MITYLWNKFIFTLLIKSVARVSSTIKESGQQLTFYALRKTVPTTTQRHLAAGWRTVSLRPPENKVTNWYSTLCYSESPQLQLTSFSLIKMDTLTYQVWKVAGFLTWFLLFLLFKHFNLEHFIFKGHLHCSWSRLMMMNVSTFFKNNLSSVFMEISQ